MKIKNYIKKIIVCAVAVFALGCCFILPHKNNYDIFASVREDISLTNGDFANNPNVTYIETSPSGWSKINSSSATAGIINVNSNTFTNSTYYLNENPGKSSTAIDDDKVLMINAKNADNSTPKNQGYKSNTVELEKNSYYQVSVLAKTQGNAKASIYVNGLEDYSSLNQTKFERFTTNNYWNEYKFYIATEEAKSISLELWLGSNLANNTTSPDAVFFDEVSLTKLSQDVFVDTVSENINVINYQGQNLVNINNANFETGDLTNWEKAKDSDDLGGYGRVMNISSKDVMESYGLEYLGTDLSKNNSYGLVISNQNASAIGYKLSSPIALAWGDYIKVSANVKVSSNMNGNAYVVLKENNDVMDMLENLGIEDEDYYTPAVNKIAINSNSSNKYANNYQTVTFYVKAHNLYNSSCSVELWLGYNDEETKETAIGTVVFDNLIIEKISADDYSRASTSSYISKVELKTTTSSESFTNGEFNSFSKQEKELSYPHKADNWEITSSNEEQTVSGVININNDIYSNIKSHIGNISNPNHITTSNNDTNNIMMLWNKDNQTQSMLSSSFTVADSKYYNLNFNYKTIATTSNTNLLTVEVLDQDKNVIYIDKNISSQTWTNYSVLVKAEATTSTLYLKVSLGYGNDKVTGYAFFDNVKLTETTLSVPYEDYVKNNNVIDFTSGKFNLKSYDKNSHDYYTPLAYNGQTENGSANHAIAGIVDASIDDSIELNPNNTNALKNMLVIETTNLTTYSFTSKETITLEKDKFYQFEIDIRTIFKDNNLVYEEDCYGAEFSLVDVKDAIIKEIKCNEFTTYTIYVQAAKEAKTNLRFAVKTIDTETSGFVFFDNFKMTEISESIYTSSASEYSEDTTKKFIKTEETEEEDKEEDDNGKGQFDFLLIPSLITGLAVIIAVVGASLRRIRFKKWTKKKQAEYDRNKTLHRDVIRQEAEEMRNKQVKELKQEIEYLENEIKSFGEKTKERFSRNTIGNRNISKNSEKEFKLYAKRQAATQKKLDSLKNRLLEVETEDYLLKLQSKLFSENLKKKLSDKPHIETTEVKPEKEKKTRKQRNKELYSKKKDN